MNITNKVISLVYCIVSLYYYSLYWKDKQKEQYITENHLDNRCALIINDTNLQNLNKSDYLYVHKAFRKRGYSIGKFQSKDKEYDVINYDLNRSVLWSHKSVCFNNSFLLILYFVHQRDFKRRQLIREFVHQNMTVDGQILNYMFVVAVNEEDTKQQTVLLNENKRFNDLLISIHKDTYANVTLSILDAMLWTRDYCTTTQFVGRVDGDSWLHLGNLVHYLQSVPSHYYYGGRIITFKAVARSQTTHAFYFPNDYPNLGYQFVYNAGGAYFLSRDVIPYINIGALYFDVIVHAGEDYMIGEILKRAGIYPYPQPTQYVLYKDVNELPWIWPKTIIVVHKLKNFHDMKTVFHKYAKTYTIPCYTICLNN